MLICLSRSACPSRVFPGDLLRALVRDLGNTSFDGALQGFRVKLADSPCWLAYCVKTAATCALYGSIAMGTMRSGLGLGVRIPGTVLFQVSIPYGTITYVLCTLLSILMNDGSTHNNMILWCLFVASILCLPTCASIHISPANIADRIGNTGLKWAMEQALSQEWPHRLPVDNFLSCAHLLNDKVSIDGARKPVLLDVRSPCEYSKGHIPGAISLPLFSDDERALVGTLYKRSGSDVAVRKGCQLVLAKWPMLLDGLAEHVDEDATLFIYCFRGGMRSSGVAWLLSQAFPSRVHLLHGGYKSFRNWAIEQWQRPRRIVVLGGKTGSGKTNVLLQLRERFGEQVPMIQLNASFALSLPPTGSCG